MTGAARVAVVAGSGISLEALVDTADREIGFEEVPGLAISTVSGHRCRFVFGRCGATPVVLQLGRLHAYEGFNVSELTRTVDVLREFGAQTIIFTNAAGGLRPEMRPGALFAATEVVAWPFRRFAVPEALYPDIAIPGCDATGVYVWMHGPCYETRAEIDTLRRLGGGAVGMSAAPELARCRELGLRAAVVSCITNNCCAPQKLTHDHVLQAAERASRRLTSVISQAIGALR